MLRFMVKVEGRLFVQATDKKEALERANVYMVDKGLASFKGTEYSTELLDDVTALPASCS